MATITEDRQQQLNPGMGLKVPCKVASAGALVLNGEQTIDGVACVAGDRVLVKNQANTVDNGIYVVSTGGWTRAQDFDGRYDATRGTLVIVNLGSTQGKFYRLTTSDNPVVFGTSAITFQLSTEVPIPLDSFPQIVDSIAALKALANPGGAQSTYLVRGYYAPGDGGGGFFRWNQADATADNAGTVIAPALGAGRWNRIFDQSGRVDWHWFGAKVDGVTNDKNAVQAAFNSGYSCYFSDGQCFLGAYNTAGTEVTVLTLSGKSNRWYGGPGVFLVTSQNTCVPRIIDLDDVHHIELDCAFTDSGYNEALTYQGAICVNATAATGDVDNVRLKLDSKNVVSTFVTGNQADTVPAHSIWGIELDLKCESSLYGTLFRNCGDDVHGTITTHNAHRSYFCYGGKHHRITVISRNHSNVNPAQDCLIKVYDGANTQDIEVNYTCFGNVSQTPCVEIENQTTTGKTIKDITVTVNDSDTTNTNNFSVFICARDAGGAILAASANVFDNIKIGGHCRYIPVIGTIPAAVSHLELFGDVARKFASPQQMIIGAARIAAGNIGFVGNTKWHVRMPDGKTWIPFSGDVHNANLDIPLCDNSMGIMNVDIDVYDQYQTTAIWKHERDTMIWTKAAGVATLQARNVESFTNAGAVGAINCAAVGGNIRYTFAGAWTVGAAGFIILRYEDQQSDSNVVD